MKGAKMRLAMMVAVAAAAALLFDATPAHAKGGVRDPGNVGIGIGAGTLASGLSLKYFQGDTALQGNIGINAANRSRSNDWLSLGFDYLFEQPSLTGDTDYWILGVSGVAGLEFLFNAVPIDFVIEYRPSIYLFDDSYYGYDWDYRRGDSNIQPDLINFGAHLRFFF
jgi:hypothetical protein